MTQRRAPWPLRRLCLDEDYRSAYAMLAPELQPARIALRRSA